MGLVAEVDAEPAAVVRIAAVARRTSCSALTDLLWPPCPHALALMDDPSVMYESAIGSLSSNGSARNCGTTPAGGARTQTRIYLEQNRVWAEGSEVGVFGSVAEGLGLSLNSVLLAKSRVFKRLRQELADLVE